MFCPGLRTLAYLIGQTTWYINVCVQYTDYKVNPMRNSIFFVLVVASIESGCGAKLPSVKPFKMEVQQGNVVTSKMLLQLRPGMTRSQVRYIMGTPLIVDSFRDNRWDYFYELRKQGVIVEKRRVILDFDKDSLVSVRGDVVAAADNPDVKTLVEAPKQTAAEKEQAWTDKLKFWKDDAAANDQSTAQALAPLAATEAKAANVVAEADGAKTPDAVAAVADAPETKSINAAAVSPVAPSAPVIAAQPEPAVNSLPVGEVSNAAENKATLEDTEIVPFIPEGEYSQLLAPTPDEMVKGNMAEANQPSAPAEARQVTEKGVSPKVESAVSAQPTPVFEQEAMPEPVVVAEPEPALTPPPAPAVVNVPKTAVPAAAVATATVAAIAAAIPEVSSAPVSPEKSPAPLTVAKSESKPAALPVAEPVLDDDEVIPFIPEGEYSEAVIPTPDEMVKGNLAVSNTPAVDAATHTVTEKGVQAEAAADAMEPPPVFVAEQLPEAVVEPEPALPPPPAVKQSVAKQPEPPAITAAPVVAQSEPAPGVTPAPVAAQAASEVPVANLPEVSKPVLMPAKPVESVAAVLPPQSEVSQDAPAGDGQINAAVAAWAQAWRSKNIGAYLGAYAPEFVAEGLPSRAAWEAQRKQRLSAKQGAITLVLNDVQVQRDGNAAVVQFEQKYAAKAYKDVLLKTLELRYASAQKRWLITHERVTPLSVSAPAIAVASAKVDMAEPGTPAKASAQATVTEASVAETSVAETSVAETSVEAALQAWAQAWRSKNISDYLAAYADDFVPEGLPSKRAWEAQRKLRLSPKQGAITLEISNVNVQKNGNEATVTFTQKYASKVYRDEMLKKLQLRYHPAQNGWLIVRETTSTEAVAPAAKRDVTAPEGSAEHLDGVLEQIGF